MYKKLSDPIQIITLADGDRHAPVASYVNAYSGADERMHHHHLHVIVLDGAFALVRETIGEPDAYTVEPNIPEELGDAPIGEAAVGDTKLDLEGKVVGETAVLGNMPDLPADHPRVLGMDLAADEQPPFVPAPPPTNPPPASNIDTDTQQPPENGSSGVSATGSPAPDASNGSGTEDSKEML